MSNVIPFRRRDDGQAPPSGGGRAPGVAAAHAALGDEALLAACGVGDAAALGALFDRHHEAVFRLVSRLLRTDPADVDDVVQSTFLAAWRSARKFTGTGSVRSYLYGIAANLVRHHVRGAVRRRVALAEVPEPARPNAPDAASIRAQQLERLGAALDELPADHRAAYVLCEIEGLSGIEAARALDVRPGTLGRWLHEARHALRLAIEGEAQ